MTDTSVTIVDYGMGNIWSVLSALRYLGSSPTVSGDPDEVRRADALVLPGVGSFRKAMDRLRTSGLDEAILEAVGRRGSKLLGICLGIQLLGSWGTEDGETAGLGLIPKSVDRFSSQELGDKKVPHIGFDTVVCNYRDGLFRGLSDTADFYFVHSYRMLPGGLPGKTATCDYGVDFLAAYEADNIFGTQFHPEKSQTNGLVLLKNFLELSLEC